MVEGGGEGGLVSEVPRQRDDDDALVFPSGPLEQLEGAIRAAVVREHHLVRAPRQRVEHGAEPPQELRQAVLLVVEGDGHRNARSGAHRVRARPLK